MSPIIVKKQSRENNQTLIRRFTKAVLESGSLYKAKIRRFRTRPKSRLAKKLLALRREKIKKEREWREKYGR